MPRSALAAVASLPAALNGVLNGMLRGQCEVCRRWRRGRLCAGCLARFAPPRPRCRRCALPLDGGAEICGECLSDPPPFESARCVADYGFPWDRLIADFKFGAMAELAMPLAAALAAAVDDAARPDVVVPVPLSPRRLSERGYDQAWELARRVARLRGVPADGDALRRPVETPHQVKLTRAARLANLRAAFVVDPRRRAAIAGRRVALVDDVLTTGATARAAAAALCAAGATAVDVWVVARTP